MKQIVAFSIEPYKDTGLLLNGGSQLLGPEETLALLASPIEGKPLKVFWDLDLAVAPLLRLLGPEMCKKLHETARCYCRPYSIFYLPGKVLSVKHAAYPRMSYYGLKQYFPDEGVPEDLDGVRVLGNRLLGALGKMGMVPRKLTSPIAIWEDCVMSHLSLPTYRDAPDEANVYAWRTAGRLWVEAHRLGYWEQAYDYDISGCFPNIAKGLVDFRHCDFKKSTKYEADALYGYCHGIVTIYDWVKVSPVMYETEEGSLESRVGTWETYLTKGQVDFIRQWGIGEFGIIDGHWLYPRKVTQPLRPVIERLLGFKEHDDGLVQLIAKGQSVGIYGYMLTEYKDGFGPYWNPIWASEITTPASLEVAEWLYRRGIGPGDNEGRKSLISINVDGVTLDKGVEL